MHEPALRWVRRVGLLAALFGALIAGRSAVGAWLIYARALDFVPFGIRDPIFHHDLSFYVFRLPAWEYAYEFLFAALIVALIISIAAHFAVGGLEIHTRGTSPAPRGAGDVGAHAAGGARGRAGLARAGASTSSEGAVIHISALVAALFILGGLGYLFEAWNLLYSTAGVVFGAGYTDVHLRLPMIRVMMVLAFVLGGALVYNAVRRRRPWWPVGGLRHLAGRPHRAPRHRAGGLAGAHRQPQPAGQGEALHRLQHRRHARGLRPHGDLQDAVLAQGRPLGGGAEGRTT